MSWRTLATWIFRGKAEARLPETDSRPLTEVARDGGDQFLGLFPAHDGLTRVLRRKLEPMLESALPGANRFSDSDANRDRVTAYLAAVPEKKRLFVFFAGHADNKRLLCGPDDPRPETLMTDSDLGLRSHRIRMFAYCCLVGRAFGPRLREPEGFFLGFRDKIPFAAAKEFSSLVDDVFSEPFQLVLEEVRSHGRLDSSTRESLRAWYTSKIKEMQPKRDEFSQAQRLALRWHRAALY